MEVRPEFAEIWVCVRQTLGDRQLALSRRLQARDIALPGLEVRSDNRATQQLGAAELSDVHGHEVTINLAHVVQITDIGEIGKLERRDS